MTVQDVADGLVAHVVAEISECADNAVVAPATILDRELDDQLLDDAINPGPTGVAPLRRAIELLGDESSMPTQDRLRTHDARDLRKYLAPQPFADVHHGPSFAVG